MLFIFAGEHSGDLHGCQLMKALPNHKFVGVGGPEMVSLGLESLYPFEEFQMFGFFDFLKTLPIILLRLRKIRNFILKNNPPVVVLIDYPGFNLRLAKSLKKNGYNGKIIQYICPTVWAWGKGRIPIMENYVDQILSIYPFEKSYLKDTKLNIKYIGNPVVDSVRYYQYKNDWASNIKSKNNLVALFPGSREGEIKRNFPVQLSAALMLKKDNPNLIFGISYCHNDMLNIMKNLLKETSLVLNQDIFFISKNYTYELMKDCYSAIAKCGTVTLELALHQRPSVVIYRLSKLNRIVAKYIIKLNLPLYAMANILSHKEIFPELIEDSLSPENLYKNVKMINENLTWRKNCINHCNELIDVLGKQSASKNAAKAIEELL